MSIAVTLAYISKQYTIGHVQKPTTLQESCMYMARSLFRKNEVALETIWALRDISLTINSGEVVGIIGRNGAGKSTLLKILSRITTPTAGTMKVNGRVASLLEVGTGFHEELTGRENVMLNGSILGMSKVEILRQMDAIIDFSGVERFIDTPIKRYSSGMRLRLGFAVAAHLSPDILIIDEVLAVGDAGFQRKCLGIMEDLHSSGRTVLFVSHNMAAVENLCTRCIWIDNGKIQEDGPARDVIQSYMSSFASIQQLSSNLSLIENRRGSGGIIYTGIELRAPGGQRLPTIRSGEELVIRLHFRADKPVQCPSFGFRLFTGLGTLVTDTSTWHHGIEIPEVPVGEGYLDLEIESLNLLSGQYTMSLWLSGAGGVIYDCVEHCAKLDVEVGNVYHSSRVIDGRYGITFFPQRWNLGSLRIEKEVESLAVKRSYAK